MILKLTASTYWHVNPKDEKMAKEILQDPRVDEVLDNLQDSFNGDPEFSHLEASI